MPFGRDAMLAYFEFRDHLASDMRRGLVGRGVDAIFKRAAACSHREEAKTGEWTDRFLSDLERERSRPSKRRAP